MTRPYNSDIQEYTHQIIRAQLFHLQKNPSCLWRVTDITRVGLSKLGYGSFEEMWEDYSVLALVRNPYDRAGSSYDYTLGRRKVCSNNVLKILALNNVLHLRATILGAGWYTFQVCRHLANIERCPILSTTSQELDLTVRNISLSMCRTAAASARIPHSNTSPPSLTLLGYKTLCSSARTVCMTSTTQNRNTRACWMASPIQ